MFSKSARQRAECVLENWGRERARKIVLHDADEGGDGLWWKLQDVYTAERSHEGGSPGLQADRGPMNIFMYCAEEKGQRK